MERSGGLKRKRMNVFRSLYNCGLFCPILYSCRLATRLVHIWICRAFTIISCGFWLDRWMCSLWSAGEELEEVHPREHGADGGAQADGPHLHLAPAGCTAGQVPYPVCVSRAAWWPRWPQCSSFSSRVTEEVTARLLKSAGNPIERDGILATRLCTHKDDVELTNENKLKQLPGLLAWSHAAHTDASPLSSSSPGCWLFIFFSRFL